MGARDNRIEAIAMSPIIKEGLTEKFKLNTDRFEEINEKIDKMKMIVETEPAATQKFFPQANAMAQLPPVTLPYGGSTLLYTTLHYTTLHYTTLHHTTLHYTTLHYTTLHYTTTTTTTTKTMNTTTTTATTTTTTTT